MKTLILFMTVSFLSAQTVEIKLPEFSKKVREQGAEKEKKASEHCTVDQDGGAANPGVTCGTDKKAESKKAPLGELGGDTSQYAQDKVRENTNKRR